MTDETKILKEQAEKGRMLYRSNAIDIKEAKTMVMPYIVAVNKKAVEIAKKYNMRPRKVNFYSYVR